MAAFDAKKVMCLVSLPERESCKLRFCGRIRPSKGFYNDLKCLTCKRPCDDPVGFTSYQGVPGKQSRVIAAQPDGCSGKSPPQKPDGIPNAWVPVRHDRGDKNQVGGRQRSQSAGKIIERDAIATVSAGNRRKDLWFFYWGAFQLACSKSREPWREWF